MNFESRNRRSSRSAQSGRSFETRPRGGVAVRGGVFEREIGSLFAHFGAEKRHGVVFAGFNFLRRAFVENGIGRGAAILAVIFWQNLIVQPFSKLREGFQRENTKKIELEGFENKRHGGRSPDWLIVLFMGLLMIIGLVLMYALSPQWAKFQNQSYGYEFDDYSFFRKQLMMYALGVVVFIAVSKVSLGLIYRYAGKFLLLGVAVCVLLGGLGFLEIASKKDIPLVKCEKGACRWLEMGVSLQPAEVLKFGVLIAVAVFLGQKISERRVNNWVSSLLPTIFLVAVMMVFIAMPPQKDLGTAISALAIVGFQMFVAGINRRNLTIFAILALVGGGFFVLSASHRLERIATFQKQEDCRNLQSEEKRDEYQICRAKIAAGSGGLMGAGIGKSVSTAGYLPEMINDSVFAAMGEIVGFFGLVAVLAIYFGLIYRVLRLSNFILNPATRLIAAGAAGWLAVHTLMNVMAIIGMIPLTGITIPLISYGGTSILFISMILGLAFNASKYAESRKVKEYKEAKDENLGSRRRVGRSRYSSRGSF